MYKMEDHQFLDGFKNKRLKFTLKSATYIGTVQRVNLNKTLVLEDVVDLQSGRTLPGVKLFFGHEILNVEFPDAPKCENGTGDPGWKEAKLTVSEFQPYWSSMKLGEDGADEEEYVDFVVVDEFYEKFSPAVMHIRKQQVIGIAADGVGSFPHARLCWLQIATKNKVYLFDILLLGAKAFKNGLAMILENKDILKVTHDLRGIASCLLTQYRISLTNVFDTQVADVMQFYIETGGLLPDRVSTLPEVVGLHLKVASSHLEPLKIKAQLAKEDGEVWYIRPCPAVLLKVMALSAIHLQPLRLVLLDALLSDYTNLVGVYLKQSKQDFVQVQDIGLFSGLELPAELRKLEQIRLERRERALHRYSLSDDGLLLRFGPCLSTTVGSDQPEPADMAVPMPGGALISLPEAPRLSVAVAEPPGGADVRRGAQQMEGEGDPTPCLAFGRGLRLHVPVDDPLELSKAPGPWRGVRSTETTLIPGAFASETTTARMGGVSAAMSRGLHAGSGPDNAMSFGRGHFFQNSPTQLSLQSIIKSAK